MKPGIAPAAVATLAALTSIFVVMDAGAATRTIGNYTGTLPEPSAALLGGLATFFLIRRRR